MPCPPVGNQIYQFNMAGQLNYPPYQPVYWSVYNSPDTTGQYSGYFGKLENIQVMSITDVDSSTPANMPTGPALGDLCGTYPNPVVVGLDGYYLPATMTPGYLQWTGSSWVYGPGGSSLPTPTGINYALCYNSNFPANGVFWGIPQNGAQGTMCPSIDCSGVIH